LNNHDTMIYEKQEVCNQSLRWKVSVPYTNHRATYICGCSWFENELPQILVIHGSYAKLNNDLVSAFIIVNYLNPLAYFDG